MPTKNLICRKRGKSRSERGRRSFNPGQAPMAHSPVPARLHACATALDCDLSDLLLQEE